MDPNLPNLNNFLAQWPPGAPDAWPQGIHPSWFAPPLLPYGPMQQQQLLSNAYMPGLTTDFNLQQAMATPQQQLQLQQASFYNITPPSDEERPTSPPPVTHQQQLQQTPTGRPTAAPPAAAVDAAAEPSAAHKPREQKRKITGENEEAVKRLKMADPADPTMQVFRRVSGRLCTVSSQRTYNVTVAEVDRRMKAPECIPHSLMIPLLKMGKVRKCGDDLKKLMESLHLNSTGVLNSNRKKPPVGTLSALLEEEAAQLAADHRELIHAHFPLVFLARLVLLQAPTQPALAAAEAAAAGPIIASLLDLLEVWLATPTATPLTDFTLITHGLGIDEVRSQCDLFSRFLSTLREECARMAQYPQALPALPAPDASLQSDPAVTAMDQAKFAEVDGRLTLQSRKYAVTVAEVTRRLRAPECLNLSILGSILRRGKTSNMGAHLKQSLAANGIRVEDGRRKAANTTCFTALLEEEALILARDLGETINRYFPSKIASVELNRRAAVSTSTAISQRREALAAASKLLGNLSSTLASLRLPVADRMPSSMSPYAHLMKNYSCLTHGYGPEVCILFLESFRRVFDGSRELLPLTC